jgi:glyoxylase-like metal-dependent hydrolase (beta-lactamase superfamily II)
VLVAGFPSAVFGTNVYVVAPEAGQECVVVDPGMEVVPGVDELLREHGLRPVAVLLTHGHLDHTFSVVPVAGSRGIPAYVHPADRELLADPMKGMGRESQQMFGGRLQWQEPEDVELLSDGAVMSVAGLEITIDHAPGHTPGSVMFRLPGSPDAVSGLEVTPTQTVLSGDVLFAGSIGRTDLPGGSHEQMLDSLRDKVLPMADDTLVLPGHGGATTVGRERLSNPFLVSLGESDPAVPPPSAPARGL